MLRNMADNESKANVQKLTFHNTPSFYVEYMKNWLAQKKKENANPSETAIVEDLAKLVELATQYLEPEPPEAETNK